VLESQENHRHQLDRQSFPSHDSFGCEAFQHEDGLLVLSSPRAWGGLRMEGARGWADREPTSSRFFRMKKVSIMSHITRHN
jgi:hypothetical protein